MNLSGTDWTPTALWLVVLASGLYHGVNPGMGWPLAVSAGLMERSSRALVAALWPLTVGHLLAMLVVLLPFALLVTLVDWQRQIQIGASLLVIGFGIFRLVNRRHPRVLARIRPTQLGLWSFAVAIAHGAGLMLVPIYLGLCWAGDLDGGHAAAAALINTDLSMAVLVSIVHSVAMIAAGGILGVAGLPLPGSEAGVQELVQSRCHLGLEPRLCGCAIACVQPVGPAMSLSRQLGRLNGHSSLMSESGQSRRFDDVGVRFAYPLRNRDRRSTTTSHDECRGWG